MDVATPWGPASHVTVKTGGAIWLSLDGLNRMTMVKGSPEEARRLAALLVQAADEEEK